MIDARDPEIEAAIWLDYAKMAGVRDEPGINGWFIEPVAVLGVRDELPPESLRFPEAVEADRLIFHRRKELLPYFQEAYSIREQEGIPKSSWWWWLDEIIAGTYPEPLPDYLTS